MSGGRAKVTAYRAQFAASDFDGLPRPVLRPADDVRLMFAGRVEKNKGVFDLLAMARNLNTGTRRYVFEVCGHGSAFDQLAEEAKRANLGDRFLMRGKLARVELLEVYARAHLVIVPTRADFTEGLPLVAAEAVLAGRPVVTSIVSNGIEPLAGALVECRVEDVDDYCDQIRGVVNAPERYAALVAGTSRAAAQFIDRGLGLDRVLAERS